MYRHFEQRMLKLLIRSRYLLIPFAGWRRGVNVADTIQRPIDGAHHADAFGRRFERLTTREPQCERRPRKPQNLEKGGPGTLRWNGLLAHQGGLATSWSPRNRSYHRAARGAWASCSRGRPDGQPLFAQYGSRRAAGSCEARSMLAQHALILASFIAWGCEHAPSSEARPAERAREAMGRGSVTAAAPAPDINPEDPLLTPPNPSIDVIPRIASHRLAVGFRLPPEQVLACGELGLVRIVTAGFEAWSFEPLRRSFASDQATFTHVVPQEGHSYLLLGPRESWVYYLPNPRLSAYGRVPALGPFQVWPDPRRREWLWVHYLKDDAVHRFELAGERQDASLSATVRLPRFSGPTVARLTTGAWLYPASPEATSAPNAWLSVIGERSVQQPSIPEQTIASSRSWRSDRAWALSPTQAMLLALDRPGAPQLTVDLVGAPYALDEEGRRLAVVTQRQTPRQRQWFVEVIEASGKHSVLELAQRGGSGADGLKQDTSDRDVCLVPTRPWVVVGGRTSLQILDYSTERVVLAR